MVLSADAKRTVIIAEYVVMDIFCAMVNVLNRIKGIIMRIVVPKVCAMTQKLAVRIIKGKSVVLERPA